MIRVFMVGMSTDKGGVEAYISNLSIFLSDEKYEIVYSWPVMEVNGKCGCVLEIGIIITSMQSFGNASLKKIILMWYIITLVIL